MIIKAHTIKYFLCTAVVSAVLLPLTLYGADSRDISSQPLLRGQISGYCFIDENENGRMDLQEEGLSGAEISLEKLIFFIFPVKIDTATTESDGEYSFSNLRAGNYIVEYTSANSNECRSNNPQQIRLGVFQKTISCNFAVAGAPKAPPAELSVRISADPLTIEKGGTSTLSWTSDNAVAASIDQGIGEVGTSGSIEVSPGETTTYMITATGADGSKAYDSVNVAVESGKETPVPTTTTVIESSSTTTASSGGGGSSPVTTTTTTTAVPPGGDGGGSPATTSALPGGDGDQVVEFPDPALEAVIRDAIGKHEDEDIFISDLLSITTLHANSQGISDITGIEYCVNLQTLHLADNQIADISALSGLVKLNILYLHYNRISDICALSGLVNLQTLILTGNQIADIYMLSRLTNLQTLHLAHNRIAHIRALSGLANLQTLYLHYNQITDIGTLSKLVNIQTLILADNQIADIYALTENPGINPGDVIDLEYNPLSPASCWLYIPEMEAQGVRVHHLCADESVEFSDPALEGVIRDVIGKYEDEDIFSSDLLSVTTLYASSQGITDITGIEYCINLQNLSLLNNHIPDIRPLAGLENLQYLNLYHNQIADISALSRLVNLQTLRLSFNQITDIRSLVENSGIGSGDVIDLSINPLSPASCWMYIPELEERGVSVNNYCADESVAFPDPALEAAIRDATGKHEGEDIFSSDLLSITTLYASSQGISNIAGIEYCVNLQRLVLADNQIADISPLSALVYLQRLVLNENRISDIRPLTGLANLRYLTAGNNQIADIGALSGLRNLQTLYLDNNQIADISPLSALANLQSLTLGNNQIQNICPLSVLAKLQYLYLDNNQIADISPLSWLENLRFLYVQDNRIADISALSRLVNLYWLSLEYNRIANIGPLSALVNLRYLYVQDNRIADISALSELLNLQYLYLDNNQIADIYVLTANSGLSTGDTVSVRDNELNTASCTVYIPELERRGVSVYHTCE